MTRTIEFWFDLSCPYAYLGSTQLDRVEREAGRPVQLQPFLLGGVFRALEQPQNMSVTLNEPKKLHNKADLLRWAAWFDVPINTPFRHPNRSVEALRALLLCPADRWRQVTQSLFGAYWVEGLDLSSRDVIKSRLDALGLPGDSIVARIDSPQCKAELRTRTERALATGVFGAPAWVVDGQLYWGQDRIEMVIRAARDDWQVPQRYHEFDFNQHTSEG